MLPFTCIFLKYFMPSLCIFTARLIGSGQAVSVELNKLAYNF